MSLNTGIPEAIRYPGVYINIDNSKANLGTDLPSVLLVGQKLPTGSAAAGEIVLASSVYDAQQKAGAGSMLAQMADRYRYIDEIFDIYLLPYSDNPAGVAATGTITVTAVATADGTLSLYVAGKLVSVGITSAMTTDQIATAIAAAFTDADIPVTAAAAASVVTLTARHKGTCGNNIDIRLGLYGELKPTGLGLTIAAMSGGSGDPAPGDLDAILGNSRWYNYVALGINDAATLAAWHAESQHRYMSEFIQQGFRCFTAHRGDYAAAAAFGETKNYEHISDTSLELNPTTPWEAAAILAAAAAPLLYDNPVGSLEDTPLPGMIGVSYHTKSQANSLLYKGMSVIQVAKDGSCYIKRMITMYQRKADGSADDSYLDINTPEAMERIRQKQIGGAKTEFTGTAAAESNEDYRPGLRITTKDTVTAFLLSLYRNTFIRDLGWCQKYAYYKSNLVVEQDPTNPSRFNFIDDPVLLSPFYILAGRSQFRKRV